MITPCPQCKKQVEHEDFLFEVVCDCGARFNPFMNMTDIPPLDGVEMPAVAAAASPEPENYAQSQAVFAELKDFAEGNLADIGEVGEVGKPAAVADLNPSPFPAAVETKFAPVPEGETILTAGDGLPGYRIDAYLPPISALCELQAISNPLAKGFEALSSEAAARGANGVVAVRWILSPDGTRVVLSGTPVRCTKEGL